MKTQKPKGLRRVNALRHYFVICLLLIVNPVALAQRGGLLATWTASPESAATGSGDPLLSIHDQTVRQRVRISVGGTKACIRLSNEYGSTPLFVGSATLAIPTSPASVEPRSIRNITFNGRSSVEIAPGAPALSDPVALPLNYGQEISISLYFPRRVTSTTWHQMALRRAVISPRGDHTHEETIQGGSESLHWAFITAVLVPAQPSQRLMVAFGDSLVDGDGSTLEMDHNWPGALVRLIGKSSQDLPFAIVNEGIAGNRLLSDGPIGTLGVSALARFDRDALSVPGVTHIVLLEGLNDLGFPGARLGTLPLADPRDVRSVNELIGAYLQLIARAHARGIELIGSTLTPFEGVAIPGYFTEEKEGARQRVNQWIRTSGAFDAFVDFDAVLRDTNHPSRLSPRFASEDHLHPNDDGYQAMAEAVGRVVK
jgi:lysophospholipase L1-like esterase